MFDTDLVVLVDKTILQTEDQLQRYLESLLAVTACLNRVLLQTFKEAGNQLHMFVLVLMKF